MGGPRRLRYYLDLGPNKGLDAVLAILARLAGFNSQTQGDPASCALGRYSQNASYTATHQADFLGRNTDLSAERVSAQWCGTPRRAFAWPTFGYATDLITSELIRHPSDRRQDRLQLGAPIEEQLPAPGHPLKGRAGPDAYATLRLHFGLRLSPALSPCLKSPP
jgi:hypothetical protein